MAFPRLSSFHRHLLGWLSYAFASEVFVIVSLTLFLPICLEQFARDNGFSEPAKVEPCSAGDGSGRCVVKIGWLWIDTASFSLYTFSFSVLLQALTVISVGNIADRPEYRKPLLLGCAAVGSVSAMFFMLLSSDSSLWGLCAVLAIVANVCFGTSVVAMNAYLPGLARENPDVKDKWQMYVTARDRDQDEAANSHPSIAEAYDAYATHLSHTTSRLSSFGIALGYGAGIFMLIIALLLVSLTSGAPTAIPSRDEGALQAGSTTFSLRLAIGLSGIWWAVFTIPAAVWLPGGHELKRNLRKQEAERNGSSGERHLTSVDLEDAGEEQRLLRDADVETANDTTTGSDRGDGSPRKPSLSISRRIRLAWYSLFLLLRPSEMKRLKETFKFLAAWFLLSDAFTTLTSTSILFAKTSLGMPASSLILLGIIVPCSGITGSLSWNRLQRRYQWTNLRVLVTLVVMAGGVPIYGCLGFIPFFKRWAFGGLTTPGEMYVLAVYFGFVLGAFQSYARSLYAELVPPGEEARWFGLFSITDKSSSFLGPLLVALISDLTSNIRYSFFFLLVMFWLALPVLGAVNVQRGREDAEKYMQAKQETE
ncbi:hypothetical protein GYMLUDRAFT_259187 [Collybiopsis luxurians FD-317 M1]|uniref:Autophagy-related protein n=1 Tax=Collybiopsis luxurians FD-317 M1 TaxID=944289 RepID=A0A0D0BJ36_9AGAR|nr:hypothetical protein GYMLUDRAFT_259187 [Collybiopsis luxurians FD-317 M1]